MELDITLTFFRLNIMFLSYFLVNCYSFQFLLSQISAGNSSFLRSKGTKRIIKSVQNFLFFSILDRILKLFFETIFKWIWTIKCIISNSHWMIYKIRMFWWDKEKEYPYQTPLIRSNPGSFCSSFFWPTSAQVLVVFPCPHLSDGTLF